MKPFLEVRTEGQFRNSRFIERILILLEEITNWRSASYVRSFDKENLDCAEGKVGGSRMMTQHPAGMQDGNLQLCLSVCVCLSVYYLFAMLGILMHAIKVLYQ